MYPTSVTSATRISPGCKSSMVSGRTIRTRPRTRPPQTPTPRRVSPAASAAADEGDGSQLPLNTVGGTMPASLRCSARRRATSPDTSAGSASISSTKR
ncbi:Uncharacterised protein [Mycobacterium tuberculosis]|nr:Uncharacterised protein [Mycobacterium tuberculosis]